MKLPKKLAAIASPVRRALRSQFHTLWYRARQRKGLRVFALGQRLRRFADHVTHTAGMTNGARVRRWFQDKKAGWYAVFADPQMPATSTLLDQAHNAIARKLFAMKGFHHPDGSQQAFLTGLAHLYNPHSIGFSGRQRSLDCQRRLPLYFPCAPSSQLRNLSENNLNNIGNLKIYH
jgi:hypothetical protein